MEHSVNIDARVAAVMALVDRCLEKQATDPSGDVVTDLVIGPLLGEWVRIQGHHRGWAEGASDLTTQRDRLARRYA